MKNQKRFEEFNEDILRVSRDYHLLMLDEDIYVRGLKILEKFGKFKATIEKEAEDAVSEIGNMGLLEDPEILRETLKTDVTFASCAYKNIQWNDLKRYYYPAGLSELKMNDENF